MIKIINDVKSFLTNITRPFRWKIIKILSPSIWAKRNIISAMPRGSTMYAIRRFGDKPITFCELGVHKGENTLDVNKRLNIKHSYLIDMYKDYNWLSQQGHDEAFIEAKERLGLFKDKITWIIKSSEKGVEDLPDDIDFIYIDGNHEYEYVRRDIELYWEKVSSGGILAGHDFCSTSDGVVTAVFEFAVKNQLHLYCDVFDWWFIKGNKDNECI